MRKKRRTKKKPTKEVVVVDDEEVEEEREQAKEKVTVNLPTSLDQALATAFSLNSASPNLTAIASTSAQAQVPPVASGSTRRLRRNTCAGPLSDSGNVEVVMTLQRNAPRTHARAQASSSRNNHHSPVTLRDRRVERGNDAIFTHLRIAHTINDVAWPRVAIPQNQTTRTMR